MLWVLVDILIGVLALACLGVVVIAGIRHIKALGRTAKAAGKRVGEVTDQISGLQSEAARRRTP